MQTWQSLVYTTTMQPGSSSTSHCRRSAVLHVSYTCTGAPTLAPPSKTLSHPPPHNSQPPPTKSLSTRYGLQPSSSRVRVKTPTTAPATQGTSRRWPLLPRHLCAGAALHARAANLPASFHPRRPLRSKQALRSRPLRLNRLHVFHASTQRERLRAQKEAARTSRTEPGA